MTLQDLEYIFQPQTAEGTSRLYFMLKDDLHKLIERHPADDLEGLLPMLDSFHYAGAPARVPRFHK
jgi:hypothetical protein